ncbi:hypothetical protein [Mucilaginibacter sp. FT3.2]|uniref:hypothetical protein n=1 Tax=Mucilaginibacter sp. FT3.2 TaxID=2723090 RepID=UPI00160C4789|nr:hypothetical protein [Mucilaginibacter sp. FT3.2]MBB6231809.1 hypothetical protein [Mucilaginibacter sp. FT3.2]
MKKALCLIALAAISFGSVFAGEAPVKTTHGIMQTDTSKTKKKVKKMKMKKKMKDTTAKM